MNDVQEKKTCVNPSAIVSPFALEVVLHNRMDQQRSTFVFHHVGKDLHSTNLNLLLTLARRNGMVLMHTTLVSDYWRLDIHCAVVLKIGVRNFTSIFI